MKRRAPLSVERDSSLRESLRPLVKVAALAVAAGSVIVAHDVVIASWFGATSVVDAYQLAASFPSAALNVFAGGTLLAALVPRLVHLDAAGDSHGVAALVRDTRRAMARRLVAISVAWAVFFPIAARPVSRLDDDALVLATALSVLHLLALVVAGMAWVDVALQNSRRRFGMLSAAPAFMPAGAVVGVMVLGPRLGVGGASIGSLVGSLAFFAAARSSAGPRLPPVEGGGTTWQRGLAGDYWASAGGAALLGGILMTDTWVASTLPPGSAATYGFATRPIILSLAFATTIVGNVLLPTFARLVSDGQFATARRQFFAISGLLVATSIPVVAIVLWWARPLVAVLYERGSFGPTETTNVATVMRAYVLHVPFFLVAQLGWRLLNSLRRNGVLLALTVPAFCVNVGLDLWLAPTMGLAGVAWGTTWAIVTLAGLIVLYIGSARPDPVIGADAGTATAKSAAKAL